MKAACGQRFDPARLRAAYLIDRPEPAPEPMDQTLARVGAMRARCRFGQAMLLQELGGRFTPGSTDPIDRFDFKETRCRLSLLGLSATGNDMPSAPVPAAKPCPAPLSSAGNSLDQNGNRTRLWEQGVGVAQIAQNVPSAAGTYFPVKSMVRTAGLEPARPYGQEILSLRCLPFHHVRARHRRTAP